ncbi:hypothetical protein H2200_001389 [Cladophialophora chaetospira]|uniref:RRM domain-containing protein n=1 Tax=Cladophialophora chaetospira TaxID=386627 RepID=A0AA38XKS0_9EURO|nr:hypothetical protein H2200_001389 [Cladophialophora chaetospira]
MNGWSSPSGVPPTVTFRAPPTAVSPTAFSTQPLYLPAPSKPPLATSSDYNTNYAGTITHQPISSIPPRPVNDGTTIFLSGLPYYQSENDLRSLLKRYGNVIYLEIHPDSRNPGKNKGTARARYKSSSEALDAVRNLDGKYLHDRKISVKQERDDPAARSPASGISRRPLLETRNPSTSKTNKNVNFSSSTKSKRFQETAKVASRTNDRSKGSTSPTGPLVVNGARTPAARRGSRGAVSESDSDESSNDSESDNDNESKSASEDDKDGHVRKVTRKLQHHRL